jgi:hypothetical protein
MPATDYESIRIPLLKLVEIGMGDVCEVQPARRGKVRQIPTARRPTLS